MRLSFLAEDRPDIKYTSKECARAMSSRTRTAYESLKRQARYLIGAKRCIWYFRRQPHTAELTCYTDANWAGCITTRKSTSCIVIEHN